ncbi:hypothetical protein, partial [Atlantibacter hermannii]|uniref:hypothetical protein n=1 Tax=Atlantibacter hermannii TaxID=565 RepID=UPI0019332562
MKTSIKLITLAVIAASSMNMAHAANADITQFIAMAQGNDFNNAKKSYFSLNDHDRAVVDSFANQAGISGILADIKAQPIIHTASATSYPTNADLIAMNQQRTAPQASALKAAQALRYHQLAAERGQALTEANQQRTQAQTDALN